MKLPFQPFTNTTIELLDLPLLPTTLVIHRLLGGELGDVMWDAFG